MPQGKARYHRAVGKSPFYWNKSRHGQLQERREAIQRDMKRKMKAQGIIGNKTPFVWEWCCDDVCGTVTAFSGGEARAKIKKALEIPKKKPLPRNVQIKRVEFNEPSA